MTDDLIRENAGLRASVEKYKHRAQAANARADRAEERARELAATVVKLERAVKGARYHAHKIEAELAGMAG